MSVIVQRNQNYHHQNEFPSLNPQNYNETNYYSNQILRLHCPNYQSSIIQSPSNSKWKSQLCKRFIAETYCPYGQKCQFAHGVEELRCNSTQQSKYKTKSCLSWQKNGYCRFEARCNFLHEKYWDKVDFRKISRVQDIEMMILMKQGIKKQSRLLRVLKE